MKPISIGDMIPDFSLKDQNGEQFDIKSVRGRMNLVIFFYPRDGSLNCTREACYFRDLNEVFIENDASVIGISSQSVESHMEFASKNKLTYTLLSDSNNEVRKLFGVPARMFRLIPGRVTYVADKTGKVIYIFDSQTDVQRHADEALKICLLLRKTNG
ncbi:MAG TPA: peroxiredoxin [Bacteroidales bacterium]|jgi:thioredoxin-dependent peroxiredoxin|nr:peroxiredoxin [Bacteroidales bacterium]HBZ21494.1 peroxiredoxin [Bacteroidales bacterium]